MAAETALTMSHDEVNLAWRDVTYDVPVKVKAKPVKQKDVNNTQPSSDGDYKRILHGLSGHVRRVRSWRSWDLRQRQDLADTRPGR